MKQHSNYESIRSFRLRSSFKIICLVLFLGTGGGVSSGTLEIELNFTKNPPRAGILYFPEDNSLSPKNQLMIDQINKRFTSILGVGAKGSLIVFKNSDSVDHNIYANDVGAKVFFDVGLAEPGKETTVRMDWDTGAIIRIGCKIHPRMKSYIANIPSSHYEIFKFIRTKKKYKVKMDGIPDDLSQVKIWFPGYVGIDTTVQIGESTEIPLLKRKKKYGTATLIRKSSGKPVSKSTETVPKSKEVDPKIEKADVELKKQSLESEESSNSLVRPASTSEKLRPGLGEEATTESKKSSSGSIKTGPVEYESDPELKKILTKARKRIEKTNELIKNREENLPPESDKATGEPDSRSGNKKGYPYD